MSYCYKNKDYQTNYSPQITISWDTYLQSLNKNHIEVHKVLNLYC